MLCLVCLALTKDYKKNRVDLVCSSGARLFMSLSVTFIVVQCDIEVQYLVSLHVLLLILIILHYTVIPYYIEVHTSDEEIDASTYSNIFITLYGIMADSGRRHLAESRSNKISSRRGRSVGEELFIYCVELQNYVKI